MPKWINSWKQTRAMRKTTPRTSCSQLRVPEGRSKSLRVLECRVSWLAMAPRSTSASEEQTDNPRWGNRLGVCLTAGTHSKSGTQRPQGRLHRPQREVRTHLEAMSRWLSLFLLQWLFPQKSWPSEAPRAPGCHPPLPPHCDQLLL